MSSKPTNDLRPAPGERLYRVLMRLYPRDFRARYGEAMVEFYRDRRREGAAGIGGRWAVWRAVIADLATSVPAERARIAADRMRRPAARRVNLAHTNATKEETMATVEQDLRFALRSMARRPAFTAVVVATLGLGIGANAAIFSVVNGVLLRPLPFRDPAGIVRLQHEDPYWVVSEPEFRDYARDARSFARLSAFQSRDANLTGEAEPERVEVTRVSDGFFSILGVPALRGRTFAPDDDMRKHPPVAILSYGVWQRRYAGDSAILGRTIALDERPLTVVGVMPQGFDYPSRKTAVWVPLRLNPDSLWTRNNHYLSVVGRLAPGMRATHALAETNALDRRWMHDFPETYFPDKPLVSRVTPITEDLLGGTRPYLLALLGAVGFVLVIACVNVANLLLARGEGRRKELAIRTALGASRRRLVRQLLTESGLLALAGGAVGVLLAWAGGRALLAMAPPQIPRLEEVRLDFAVLLFTLCASILTGALFGFIPALRIAGGNSATTLKEGGKTSAPGATRRARSSLVVVEVALAVVMLAGAGLLVRSLSKLQSIDLGFDPSNVLTMGISLPPGSYDDTRSVQFFHDLLARVRVLPGAREASAMGWAPLADGGGMWSIFVDGKIVKTIAEAPSAQPAQVTPGYFKTLGMVIVRGRGFTDGDRVDAPMVVVVNETMARQLWPGRDPLGHTIKMFSGTSPWATVVGVVRDIKSSGRLNDVPATMFFPYAQAGKSAYYTPRQMTLAVRTAGEPLALAAAVRQSVRALDRTVPISDVRTMDEVVGASIASRRFTTALLGAFAVLAVALAAIGIYGVISYGVSQRTYEIGVRLALGAQREMVLRLVMAEGLRLTLAGLAIGLAGAVVVARLIRSLLVGVAVIDPPALAVAAAALIGVSLLASLVPARRAMAVSPTEALRNG